MIKTHKLTIIEEPEHGFILVHTFVPDDDPHKHTDFYICGNRKSAETLMRCIRKPNEFEQVYNNDRGK